MSQYFVLLGGDWIAVTKPDIEAAFAEGRLRYVCRYPVTGHADKTAVAILPSPDADWDTRDKTYAMDEASWTMPVDSLANALRCARIEL